MRTHQDCFETIEKLLGELGMGYRVGRMKREDEDINIERVYVMACRAHKLHRARVDLIGIFDQVMQFEEMLPKVKELIMRKLTDSA